ncbi:MAG TPA: hypothetical protein PKD85_15805 [Saprospiraceae bacterium]|nr:hypothetical protein [Saprospiraceae bacterium]
MKSKMVKGIVGLLVLSGFSLNAQFDDLYSEPIKKVKVQKASVTNNFNYNNGDYDSNYGDADANDYYNDSRRITNYYDDLDYTYARRINTFHRSSFVFANPYRFAAFNDPFAYSFYDPFFDPFWGGNNVIVNVGIGGGFGFNRWNRWNTWNTWGSNNWAYIPSLNNWGYSGWGYNSWGFNNGWNNWNACPPGWTRPVFVNNYYNNVGSTVNNNPNNVGGVNRYYGSRTTSSTTTSTAGRVDGPRSYRGTTPTDQNLTTRSGNYDNATTPSTSRRSTTETTGSRPSIYSRGTDISTATSAESTRSVGRSADTGASTRGNETQRSVYSRSSDNYSGGRTTTSTSSSSPSRSASSDYGRSSSSSSGSSMGSSRSSSSSMGSSSSSSSSGSSSGGGGRSSGRGG